MLAVLTAVTVVVSMRIVGLLLISALMIVPNATSQLIARSFRSALWWAVAHRGRCAASAGWCVSYVADTPSGGTIVLLAIAVFIVASVSTAAVARVRRARHDWAERHDHEHGPDCGHPAVDHGDHVDYVHDGHRHAPHEGHYDEHGHHDEHGDRAGAERDDRSAAEPSGATRQRAAVADLLDRIDDFRSAQDIHAAMAGSGTTVGLATVYRTLQALAADGEIDVLRSPDGEAVYRRCSTGHHHHLLPSCRRTVDRGAGGRGVGRRVSREHGSRRRAHGRDRRTSRARG